MKVYIMLADGFEETEALVPWDVLKRAGAEVQLVSVSASKRVTGAHGLAVEADS
ncbi:MAG: DJ-1/PfpI family protein, partial [Clostridia bacterium]|nr:DJ-1/PfpI family protein [Clostridia bacterium]